MIISSNTDKKNRGIRINFHGSFIFSYKKIPNAFAFGIFGAAKQIRTADLVITNDVLYHLSYSSIFYAADFHLRHKWRP